MSEVIFESNGLKIIKYCGKQVAFPTTATRTRYELIREFDDTDPHGNLRMTLSEEQVMALVTSFPVPEPVLATEDLVLTDREILPISDRKFGVVITEEEASTLPQGGYKVMEFPVQSRRTKTDPSFKYYIDVYLKKDDRLAGKFDITGLAIAGRGNVTVEPLKWQWADGVGVKAFVKAVEVVPC